ncbi:MAG: glycosyltransferase family 2 protein [candidate division Zixibacteria bacterium]|nr:glycosyltransferase family 2 protein [candidate division Zixibacteria bacterium]
MLETNGRKTALSVRTALVLPTLNAGPDFVQWLASLRGQDCQPDRLLLVDSSSTDQTVELARDFGFEITTIARLEFSHGGTRQSCVDRLTEVDAVIFLTQDAVLASPQALSKLLGRFDDPKVGAVYGRQLPRPDAGAIEAHARLFNYPETPGVRTAEDIARLGLKTSFISNSFAAWRRRALIEVGGFPAHTIQNEDTHAASRMILAGWKVAYAADACVYHSHPFTWRQEFRRYFDIGVFHGRDPWIRQNFGKAGGEGLRFVSSELKYLRRHQVSAIPSAMIRTALKLLGYEMGNHERRLPLWTKRLLSANTRYWATTEAQESGRL